MNLGSFLIKFTFLITSKNSIIVTIIKILHKLIKWGKNQIIVLMALSGRTLYIREFSFIFGESKNSTRIRLAIYSTTAIFQTSKEGEVPEVCRANILTN